MAETISLPKILSLSRILSIPHPQQAVKQDLTRMLKIQLKNLGVVWNAEAFNQALNNPALPVSLLKKLERLISIAETTNWDISPALKREIDETVEDIEIFNPDYQARAQKQRQEFEEELKKGELKTYSLE